MLNKVNAYIKKYIKGLSPKDRKELINFATFLRKQEAN